MGGEGGESKFELRANLSLNLDAFAVVLSTLKMDMSIGVFNQICRELLGSL